MRALVWLVFCFQQSHSVEEAIRLLESDAEPPIRVATGGIFGLVETLANLPWSRQAKVVENGRALRLNRDDLLAALSDLGFLESLLCSVVSLPREAPAA